MDGTFAVNQFIERCDHVQMPMQDQYQHRYAIVFLSALYINIFLDCKLTLIGAWLQLCPQIVANNKKMCSPPHVASGGVEANSGSRVVICTRDN